MMKKIILILLIVLLIISGLLFSIFVFVKSENKVTYSLEPFNETLKTPDFFSIVDYSIRSEGILGKISRDIELHLLGGVDGDSASKYYYPYNIFIFKDYTMFVESAKGGDFVYLKGSVTSDEYKYIKSMYDSSNKKEAY